MAETCSPSSKRGGEGGRRGGLRPKPRLLLGLSAVLVVLLLMGLLPDLFRPGGGPGGTPPAPPRPAGRVLGPDGGPPPPGTRVTATGPGAAAAATPDADGAFRFDPRPEGATRFIAEWGPLRAEAPVESGPATLRLPERFAVSGRVVDAGSGEPVPGAEVACGAVASRTDDRGRFRLAEVPVAGARPPPVRVAAEGYAPLAVDPSADDRWDDLFLRLGR